jgi:acetyl-CoA synthetase
MSLSDSASVLTTAPDSATLANVASPGAWWLHQSKRVTWVTEPSEEFEWPTAIDDWFRDGTLNGSFSCTDIHVIEERRERVAYHWFGDREGDTRTITYFELHVMINHATNALIELGVKPLDRVAVYSPCVPEAIVAMLAITRLGATHVVISTDTGPDEIGRQIEDSGCSLAVVADGFYRRDGAIPLKSVIDGVLRGCPSVTNVLVVRRTGEPVEWIEGRDHWWHETVDRQSDSHWCDPFPSDQPFFILYPDRGSNDKPIHRTTGGYLTEAATTYASLMKEPFDDGVLWTAAELNELAGHSHVVYGPLINGATQLVFEGGPTSWTSERWAAIVRHHEATVVYVDGSTICGIE